MPWQEASGDALATQNGFDANGRTGAEMSGKAVTLERPKSAHLVVERHTRRCDRRRRNGGHDRPAIAAAAIRIVVSGPAVAPEPPPGSGRSRGVWSAAVDGRSRERLEYPQHRTLDGAACRDLWHELPCTGQAGMRTERTVAFCGRLTRKQSFAECGSRRHEGNRWGERASPTAWTC